eukprot:CAMPEP_0117445650 /NCGR_PEP_ID=MMETSP0759-20121206/5912_1 /TAXON_ID=63605 /ORGANISM="Percolomonas cosmopolitus, Strain WS" /LENGTH=47 /DNA_ID= /DNA_START= /DNA_END= /DNA_ORIENTATION=
MTHESMLSSTTLGKGCNSHQAPSPLNFLLFAGFLNTNKMCNTLTVSG